MPPPRRNDGVIFGFEMAVREVRSRARAAACDKNFGEVFRRHAYLRGNFEFWESLEVRASLFCFVNCHWLHQSPFGEQDNLSYVDQNC